MEPILKAIRLSPDPSGEVLEHYGDILFRNGKTEEAAQTWKKAKEKGNVSGDIDQKIVNGLK
jgi:predicted negative regulator of RcsB-dependent stress response